MKTYFIPDNLADEEINYRQILKTILFYKTQIMTPFFNDLKITVNREEERIDLFTKKAFEANLKLRKEGRAKGNYYTADYEIYLQREPHIINTLAGERQGYKTTFSLVHFYGLEAGTGFPMEKEYDEVYSIDEVLFQIVEELKNGFFENLYYLEEARTLRHLGL